MNHTAEIREVKETDKGTYLQLYVPNSFLETKIERFKQGDKAYTEIRIDDNRNITAQQRKKYYSTLKDISDYTGHLSEEMHDYFKMLYRCLHEDIKISMSDCTVTQAKDMITILIAFIMSNDIPLTDVAINRVEDIDKYLYGCLVNRRCSCCGKRAEIHHVDKVGMGRDRKKIDHKGMRAIAICRNHHTEMHAIGENDFEKKHKVYGIVLDEYAVKKLNL